MSNPWAGKLAKHISSAKRPRYVWNIIFSIGVFCTVFATAMMIYQVVGDCATYSTEQVFISYKDGCLYTDIQSFEILEYEQQEVPIKNLRSAVDEGENIELIISEIDGSLIEVKKDEETIYKIKTFEIYQGVLLFTLFLLPMLILFIFMLVATNIKNPSKRMDKFQSQYILRFYK